MQNILPLLLIDGYKTSHRTQYPKDTTLVYSNFTPRGIHHIYTTDSYQSFNSILSHHQEGITIFPIDNSTFETMDE